MTLHRTNRNVQKAARTSGPEGFKYDVFLSFASGDTNAVRPVCDKLRLSGLQVFYFDISLKDRLGEPWFQAIQSAIEGSKHFLLFASDASMASPWVQQEYMAFYNHCYTPGIRRLIPLAIGRYKICQLPLFLRDLEGGHLRDEGCLESAIQLFGGTNFAQLTEQLAATRKENKILKHKLASAMSQLAIGGARSRMSEPNDAIEGKRLFQHAGYYPIKLANGTNIPSLSRDIFLKAIKYFSQREDRLAATDLVYLREDNLRFGEADVLLDRDLKLYARLIQKYELDSFITNLHSEHDRLFRNFIRLVDEIGDTLKGIKLEVVLHNVRNPVHSVIAARNTDGISNRKVGDPSTRFVVDYLKNQGRLLMKSIECSGKVAYLKQFNGKKFVKATTTPLYDRKYGLIGILCINIDIGAVHAIENRPGAFFKMYLRNSGTTPGFEQDTFVC